MHILVGQSKTKAFDSGCVGVLATLLLLACNGCASICYLVGQKAKDDPSQIQLGIERAEVIRLFGLPDAQFTSKNLIDVYKMDGGNDPNLLAAMVVLPFEVFTFGFGGLALMPSPDEYQLHFRYDDFDRLISVEPGDRSKKAYEIANKINYLLPVVSKIPPAPAGQSEEALVAQLEKENKHWLYDAHGRPSTEGLIIQKYIEDARAQGINGARARWEYATDKLASKAVPSTKLDLEQQKTHQPDSDGAPNPPPITLR